MNMECKWIWNVNTWEIKQLQAHRHSNVYNNKQWKSSRNKVHYCSRNIINLFWQVIIDIFPSSIVSKLLSMIHMILPNIFSHWQKCPLQFDPVWLTVTTIKLHKKVPILICIHSCDFYNLFVFCPLMLKLQCE